MTGGDYEHRDIYMSDDCHCAVVKPRAGPEMLLGSRLPRAGLNLRETAVQAGVSVQPV